MEDNALIQPIAHIRSDFGGKFGIPRQSGTVMELSAKIVFEKEYRNADALRGLDGFSHIWLIWHFSQAPYESFTPTVRPPRLGGNKRVGVFATRSPFRPNSLGLSCVKIDRIEQKTPEGPVIYVLGADLLDGTPIYDIKPYLPYTDSIPDAQRGFSPENKVLEIVFPVSLEELIPAGKREALRHVLSLDARVQYQDDPERIYKMTFAGVNIGFTVKNGVLEVVSTERICEE